jgi:hypothetical protein
MIFFCCVLMGVLVYSIDKGQEVAHLKGQVDGEKRTRIIACQAGRPKTNQLVDALILILDQQRIAAEATVKNTKPDSPLLPVRKQQVQNFKAGVELLRLSKKAPCT